MQVFGWIVLGIIGVVVLSAVGVALNIITIPWLKLTSQVQTNRDIVERTYNADNALYNYRWFKDRHEAILATEKKIVIAKEAITDFELSAGERSTWTFEDKTEHSRLNSVFLGLRTNYEDLVAEYNSRAKQVDRAVFQNELPLFFDLRPF